MATPPEQLEKIAGVVVEKTIDGAFKVIESLDRKVDMLLQALINAGLHVPKKPGG